MRRTMVKVQVVAALAGSLFLPLHALGSDCPACGTVSVSVVGASGEVVEGGAYLALARADGSFREPAAEALSDGSPPSAVWQVPPGKYKVTCFAQGFGFSRPIEAQVRKGETARITCPVVRALPLSGQVLSQETGKPIEGATVTPVRFAVARFATMWSDVAQDYLRREFSATTDRRGSYSIFVPPNSRNAFLIEAPGAASEIVHDVVVLNSPVILPDVVLPQAGVLQVSGSFPPSADPEKYIAVIFSFSRLGFDKKEDLELWPRHLGPDGTAEWRSLPPGYWAVRLDTGDGHRLTLGSAHVTPGGFASLQFGIAAARLLGVVKGIPNELIGSARVLLSPGHTMIESGLAPSAEKEKQDEASFEARLWLPGVYGVLLSLGTDPRSTVALGTATVKPGASGTIERTFEMPSRKLGGTVLDATGAPVEGAQVLVCSDENGLFFESEACTTRSDASGHWGCSWLPNGKLLVLARKENAGVSQIEPVQAGVEGSAVMLRLAAGAEISGQLVVPGDTSPGTSLVGFACEPFPALVVQGRTGPGGNFELTTLPSCDGQLIVRPADKALAFVWRRVATHGETDLGELRAERAGAVFAVGNDLPPEGAKVLLRKQVFFEGTRFCAKLFGGIGGVGTGLPNFPGAAGYFYKLPPGSYGIEWVDQSGSVVARSVDFEVRAGETREVSFAAR